MKKIITNIDQHGRMLIPSNVRKQFKIEIGDKVTLEIDDDEITIKNVNHTIDEMHNIFIKYYNSDNKHSITDDFIQHKREDAKIEKSRSIQ